jgi:hypothetical protein
MSAASVNNLQAAASIASAVANSLAATPNAPMTAGSVAAMLGTVIEAAGPIVNPNIGLAIALASIGLNAIHVATQTGAGLTADQFAQLQAADDAALAADAAAHPA